MNHIFEEIATERKRQHEKWGEQNHLMINVPLTSSALKEKAAVYKKLNNSGEHKSWFWILMEEVYEAFSETVLERIRAEMIQVAAVCVQIIEYLDRHIEGGKE